MSTDDNPASKHPLDEVDANVPPVAAKKPRGHDDSEEVVLEPDALLEGQFDAMKGAVMDRLKVERERHAEEMALKEEELAKLRADRDRLQSAMQGMNNEIAVLESNMSRDVSVSTKRKGREAIVDFDFLPRLVCTASIRDDNTLKLIEYLTWKIIHGKDWYERLTHFKALHLIWSQLVDRPRYGRVYACYEIAKLVAVTEYASPKLTKWAIKEPIESLNEVLSCSPEMARMDRWTPHQWTCVEVALLRTLAVIVRNDGTVQLGNEEDGTLSESRAAHKLFNYSLNKMRRKIGFNRTFSIIRKDYEVAMDKNEWPQVDQSVLENFCARVKQDFENDEEASDVLRRFWSKADGTIKPAHPENERGNWTDAITKSPFVLEQVRERLIALLHHWAKQIWDPSSDFPKQLESLLGIEKIS